MPADPVRGRRWADHRGTLEAIAWKYRINSPWRDLPEELASFQTAHKRLIRWAVDGTWEKIFAAVLAAADAVDDIGWTVVITNRTIPSSPRPRRSSWTRAWRTRARTRCGRPLRGCVPCSTGLPGAACPVASGWERLMRQPGA
jgi:transposase